MDTLTPLQRHKNMSCIRSKDTSPEKAIRKALHREGFRYRICDKRYPGKPDIILPHYYAVIFINGCFWQKKFQRNKARDAENLQYYREQCWRVCVVWECSIREKNKKQKIESVKDRIIQWLEEEWEPYLEIKGN